MRREKENPATIAALRRQPYEHLPRTSQEVREREAAAAAEEAAAAAAAAAAAQVEPQAAHTQRRRKAKADEGAEGKVSRQQRDADTKAEREKAAAERKMAAARDRAAKEEEAAKEEADCGVCGDGVSSDFNQIVICEGRRRNGRVCGVAVHQRCYGLSGPLPEQWLCDECSAGGGHAGEAHCMLCEKTCDAERPPDWSAASHFSACPMSTCMRPASASSGATLGLVHTICALAHAEVIDTLETDDEEDKGPNASPTYKPTSKRARFMWKRGKPDLDIQKRRKFKCIKCSDPGAGCVQCVSKKCTRAIHPLCAARFGLLEITKDPTTRKPYCRTYCTMHMPKQSWYDDDESDDEIVTKLRTDRHTDLMAKLHQGWPVGGGAGASANIQVVREPNLGPLRAALGARKRPPSLSDMWHYPPRNSLPLGVGPIDGPSLIHALAGAPGGRLCAGREASTTDGISLALSFALRSEEGAAIGTRPSEPVEEDKPSCVPSDGASSTPMPAVAAPTGFTASGWFNDSPAVCTSCNTSTGTGGRATPATALPVRREPSNVGRRGLCQCRDGCVGGVHLAYETEASTIGFCGHSPFWMALKGRHVERALWLYRASHAKAPPAEQPATAGEADDQGARPAAAALPPPTPSPPAVEAADALLRLARSLAPLLCASGTDHWTRSVQLLMLLGAQALLPDAGARKQMDAARAACVDGKWPIIVAGGSARRDLSCGCEIGMPEIALDAESSATPPPPFLYINECVAVDLVPQWYDHRPRDCKCCAKRTKFCAGRAGEGGRTCACVARQAECGLGCGCASQPEKCDNRELQGGLRKRLKVLPVASKGWGVVTLDHIHKGDFVVEYVGEIISVEESHRREALCPESALYFFNVPTGRSGNASSAVIDAYAVRNVAAFINFSCDPNLEVKPIAAPSGDKRIRRVAFFAARDIKPQEELGYRRDPNACSSRSRDASIACSCGSSLCHGYV